MALKVHFALMEGSFVMEFPFHWAIKDYPLKELNSPILGKCGKPLFEDWDKVLYNCSMYP